MDPSELLAPGGGSSEVLWLECHTEGAWSRKIQGWEQPLCLHRPHKHFSSFPVAEQPLCPWAGSVPSQGIPSETPAATAHNVSPPIPNWLQSLESPPRSAARWLQRRKGSEIVLLSSVPTDGSVWEREQHSWSCPPSVGKAPVPPSFTASREIPKKGGFLCVLAALLSVLLLESQPGWSGRGKLISPSPCADKSHLQLKVAKCDFPS